MPNDPLENLLERALKQAADSYTDGDLIRELVVVVRAQQAASRGAWNDAEDLYTPDIRAAHPLNTKRFDLYEQAIAMVATRRDKYALIDCINWLLARIDKLINVARLASKARHTGRGSDFAALTIALRELGF